MSVIIANFSSDVLTLTFDEERRSVSVAYRDHPEVFGHPRFLMADFDKSVALVRNALRELVRGWRLLPPKITVTINRKMEGGITTIDRKLLAEIFLHGGARAVTIQNA